MPEATTTSATADENFSIRSYLGQTVLPAVSEALMDLEKLEERCVASRARPQFAARDRAHHRSLAAAQAGATHRVAREPAPRDPRP